MDFTNLNNAFLKDDYPLPKIDKLVDSTPGYALLSFMDANVGYHQIPLAAEDRPHTAFITPTGVYCYMVMPFDLKNIGETYQRMVNKIFKDQIERNLEVYLDDMIAKSKRIEDHAEHLRETFETLLANGMRLNLEKCVFRVTGGKCLGFLVDKRGIEANPDKIQAILAMKSPRTVKEVQHLTGCISALSRFMSTSVDRCSTFFCVLKQAYFKWDEEVEKAFIELKIFLAEIPRLVSPLSGETLFLYISVSNYSLNVVLVAEREKQQVPVYYISHAFRGSESCYSPIEKSLFALVIASRKIKPFFQSHPIVVRTSQPIRKLMESKNQSARVADWANQLADYEIEYEPRTACGTHQGIRTLIGKTLRSG